MLHSRTRLGALVGVLLAIVAMLTGAPTASADTTWPQAGADSMASFAATNCPEMPANYGGSDAVVEELRDLRRDVVATCQRNVSLLGRATNTTPGQQTPLLSLLNGHTTSLSTVASQTAFTNRTLTNGWARFRYASGPCSGATGPQDATSPCSPLGSAAPIDDSPLVQLDQNANGSPDDPIAVSGGGSGGGGTEEAPSIVKLAATDELAPTVESAIVGLAGLLTGLFFSYLLYRQVMPRP